MDAPSSFFFNLEKQHNERQQILDILLADLPNLVLDNKDMLDLPLTLEELKAAAFQMSLGRAPGIDEPLLGLIRKRVKGVSIQGLPCVSISAYADDVSVFVSNRVDVQELEDCLQTYSAASSAKVNWGKSGALLGGPWSSTEAPRLPGGLLWNKTGLKVLGIHFGSAEAVRKNWECALMQILEKLAKWTWLLSQLSYRGRVLIINNLVASTLWHRLAVLNAPPGLLAEIQRRLVAFFWSGQR
ncbi:hypothetical protein AOLI_G00249380 [Acnodon oligacanthus]